MSYNGSTVGRCPNTFIVSSRIDWAPYLTYVCTQVANGDPIETDWVGTIATGSVVLTDINEQAAAAGTVDYVASVKAQLEVGELHVFDTATFTVGGETLATYLADVDTDAAFAPDTEAIYTDDFGSFFNESDAELRSAPYFDVQIDGIELLNAMF